MANHVANPDSLRAIRERTGIGPRELARTAGIGHVTYWRIESGRQKPRAKTLKRIADALGVPVTAISTAPVGDSEAA